MLAENGSGIRIDNICHAKAKCSTFRLITLRKYSIFNIKYAILSSCVQNEILQIDMKWEKTSISLQKIVQSGCCVNFELFYSLSFN